MTSGGGRIQADDRGDGPGRWTAWASELKPPRACRRYPGRACARQNAQASDYSDRARVERDRAGRARPRDPSQVQTHTTCPVKPRNSSSSGSPGCRHAVRARDIHAAPPDGWSRRPCSLRTRQGCSLTSPVELGVRGPSNAGTISPAPRPMRRPTRSFATSTSSPGRRPTPTPTRKRTSNAR